MMSIGSKPFLLIAAAVFAGSIFSHGQSAATSNLPDSPTTQANMAQSDPPASRVTAEGLLPSGNAATDAGGEASIAPSNGTQQARPFLHRVVPADHGPQPLTAPQKFEMSFRSRVGLGAIGSSIFGSGERQLFNSRPHYGTDSGAFGERLGAAELGQVTESFFSYGLYAAAFHEDPHYYVMGGGPGHSIAHRAVYSATRVVLTRDDNGNTGVNWAKLVGMASAKALTNTYYPPQDRGFGQTISAYGSSLATSVLTLELHEFMPDVMHAVLHRRRSRQ